MSTIKRFTVYEGINISICNTSEWRYTADRNGIDFNNVDIPDRKIHVDGDYIGTEVGFICAGELSRFIGKIGEKQ